MKRFIEGENRSLSTLFPERLDDYIAPDDRAIRPSGAVRREFLDHVPFWSAHDLERKLLLFKEYYNWDCVHRGLDGAIPDSRPANKHKNVARLDNSCCRGLYQLSIAA